MHALESQWWIIELPSEWDAQQEEETIVISDEDGVGEIIITTMEKQEGEVTDSELVEFTQELNEEHGAGRTVSIGEFYGYYYQYRDQGDAMREWYLRCGNLLVLITYSCDDSNAGMDDAAVDEILSTLVIKKEAA